MFFIYFILTFGCQNPSSQDTKSFSSCSHFQFLASHKVSIMSFPLFPHIVMPTILSPDEEIWSSTPATPAVEEIRHCTQHTQQPINDWIMLIDTFMYLSQLVLHPWCAADLFINSLASIEQNKDILINERCFVTARRLL